MDEIHYRYELTFASVCCELEGNSDPAMTFALRCGRSNSLAQAWERIMQDDLRGQVARYRWYHSIDLGNGVVTPGRKSFATCTAEAHAIFGRVDLSGRTVLDVGAWNGFFSFEAKRRGAARVLATDSVAWTRPRNGMREPFDLARSVLGLDVEAREIDVAQLSTDTVGEFDIVLYLGVFYHRLDAIEALACVARLARQLL